MIRSKPVSAKAARRLFKRLTKNRRLLNFSEQFICKFDGTVYEEPEPRLFSFNSPFGACPTCQGFGNSVDIDFDLVVPNENLSLEDDAIDPFSRPQYEWAKRELLKFARNTKIDTTVPFADLTEMQKQQIFEGAAGLRGVRGFFKWLDTKKYKLHVRVFHRQISRLYKMSRMSRRTFKNRSAKRQSRRFVSAGNSFFCHQRRAEFFR